MGGRSGGSYGKSARPKFEGGTGGTRRPRGYAARSLGAAAYRPALIEEKGKQIDKVVDSLAPKK